MDTIKNNFRLITAIDIQLFLNKSSLSFFSILSLQAINIITLTYPLPLSIDFKSYFRPLSSTAVYSTELVFNGTFNIGNHFWMTTG